MPRMLDLIRNSQVPVNLMQSAARGSLSVPPGEMIEILVYLALHHKLFGEQARMTLAGWDEKTSIAAAADPATSAEVLGYFASVGNLRTCLLPALAENPSVTEELLDGLSSSGSRSVVEILLASERVMSSTRLLRALQANPVLRPNEIAEMEKKLAERETDAADDEDVPEIEVPNAEIESAVTKYLDGNAKELAAETGKPFQAIGITYAELNGDEDEAVEPTEVAATVSVATSGVAMSGAATSSAPASGASSPASADAAHRAAANATAAAKAAKAKKRPALGEEKRDSTLQKIAKLDIKGRIALAMRGNKEDRTILIRDSTKLVALAVLESPKITDAEVEKIALQKNVLESVLRAIPMKRKFAKNYNIMRNIVYNPRSPLDTSLGLMKMLLTRDLKNLSENKEVSETIRKMATRMFKQKLEKKD